jgi:hypothetical protein
MVHSLNIKGYPGVIEVAGIGFTIGMGDYYYPILDIQIDINCKPLKQGGDAFTPYTIIEMTSQLLITSKQISHSPILYIFADVKERSVSWPCHFHFLLDSKRIERIEETRRGEDIIFELQVEGLASIGKAVNELVRIWSPGPIKVEIPQSHWVKEILSKWNYGQVKLVEIYFPESYKHNILKESYQHIEKAIYHFNNGNDRETLASVYSAFESMAKKIGYESPDQNFFYKLLENIENDKRNKSKLLLDYFCRYLHLGRHEPNKPPVPIERKDSEFALTMAQLIYSYLSKIFLKEVE